jgi:hypothetical protein
MINLSGKRRRINDADSVALKGYPSRLVLLAKLENCKVGSFELPLFPPPLPRESGSDENDDVVG